MNNYPVSRNVIRIAVSSALCMVPVVSNASAPMAFDQYTIDATAASVTFSASCPAGFTCSTTASDDGFLQRDIFDGTKNYVQTLLADTKASINTAYDGQTGLAQNQMEYVDEIFVNKNGATGSARKTRVASLGTGTTDISAPKFTIESDDTRLNGSFWTSTDALSGLGTEKIVQVVSNTQGDGTSATDFFVAFDFKEISTNAGASATDTGRQLRTVQLLGDAGGGKEVMAHTDLSGQFISEYTDGSVSVGGKVVNTQAGDESFHMIWHGQDFTGVGRFGVQKAEIAGGPAPRIEGVKASFVDTGFVGTVAQTGFGWDDSLGTGLYAPSF